MLSDDVPAEGSEVLMPKLYHAAPVKATAKTNTRRSTVHPKVSKFTPPPNLHHGFLGARLGA
jgi:hypothetical protein